MDQLNLARAGESGLTVSPHELFEHLSFEIDGRQNTKLDTGRRSRIQQRPICKSPMGLYKVKSWTNLFIFEDWGYAFEIVQ